MLDFRPTVPRRAAHAGTTGDHILRPGMPATLLERVPGGKGIHDAQAGVPSAKWLRAQLAFKELMVRGILQFTPSIAFRYVLHRCKSRDIRCRESLKTRSRDRARRPPPAEKDRGPGTANLAFYGSLARFVLTLFVCRDDAGLSRRPAPARRGRRERFRLASPDRYVGTVRGSFFRTFSAMILPQVHLRKPCYDFSFL